MKNAIEDANTQKMSLRQAAYGVSVTTLWRRIDTSLPAEAKAMNGTMSYSLELMKRVYQKTSVARGVVTAPTNNCLCNTF